jgi:hypothetical protein
VLRVLANLLSVHGVDYVSSDEIRDALRLICRDQLSLPTAGGAPFTASVTGPTPSGRWVDIPPYQIDVLVRGSEALAKTKDGHAARDVI